MNEMIASWLNGMSTGYFISQTVTIFMLFIFGSLIVSALCRGRASLFEILLSFPVGISVYSLAVFLMLVLHIRLTCAHIALVLAVTAAICAAFVIKKSKAAKMKVRTAVIAIITVLCIAVISTSGLLPVSISNDSLYYYSMYPSALVHYGEFRKQFNVFFTDVGQTSAMLNTLPAMFGFNEAFGVQWFLNINTLLIMVYALWERLRITDHSPADAAKEDILKNWDGEISPVCKNNKRDMAAVLIMTGVLVTSMPYVIMSRWAMSNGYFMCFMFICIYTAWKYSNPECLAGASADDINSGADDEKTPEISGGGLIIQGILFTMMAFLRMEGCIVALILLLCISTLKTYSNRQLSGAFLLPVFVLSVLYDFRIFNSMEIDAPYTFLTKTKALIQLAALAAVGVYLLFIRGAISDRIIAMIRERLVLRKKEGGLPGERQEEHMDMEPDSCKYIRVMIPAGLIVINAVLFLYNKTLYIENMKAFIANISNQSGWGLFPMIIIGVYVMCAVASKRSRVSLTYEDLCFVSYLLTALAVSFARDDALRESIGDSGNRVMLQGILLAFYAAAVQIIGLFEQGNTLGSVNK